MSEGDKSTDREPIAEKAEEIIAKAPPVRRLRDRISWPGVILLGTCLLLIAQALVKEVIV